MSRLRSVEESKGIVLKIFKSREFQDILILCILIFKIYLFSNNSILLISYCVPLINMID